MACPMFIPRGLFQTNRDLRDCLTGCDRVAAFCANVGIDGGYEMDFD